MQKVIVVEQGMAAAPRPAAHDLGTRTVGKQKGRESSFVRTATAIVTGVIGLAMGHGLTAPDADRVLRQGPAMYSVIGRWLC